MNRAHHLVLAAAIAMGLLAVGALMNGPSDNDFEQAVAADLQDATTQARREAHQVRIELAHLEAEDDSRTLLPAREPAQRVALAEPQ